ncbi:MAG: hypothetical protein JNK05_02300 [Myxococcales bacterium]|nr:hypothetical protein [Myxococcales bacterium]
MKRLFATLALASLTTCGPPLSQLVIRMDGNSEFVAGPGRISGFQLSLSIVGRPDARTTREFRVTPNGAPILPGEIGVVLDPWFEGATLEAEFALLTDETALPSRQYYRAAFVRSEVRTFRVFIDAQCLTSSVACDAESTCERSRCVPRLRDTTPLRR